MADSDIAALIAAGPGASAAGGPSAPRYIGVPAGYSYQATPRTGIPFMAGDNGLLPDPAAAPRPARYQEGTELLGTSWSPERRATIQAAMDRAGLFSANSRYRLGLWDETSQEAFSKVLGYANQNGLDFDTALGELESNPARENMQRVQPRQGAVTELTPAVTLEQQVQQAARQRLGRRLKANEVQRFVSIYQGLETTDSTAQVAAQRAAQGQEGGAGAGVVDGVDTMLTPQTPGVGAGAEGFIDSQYAQEAAGQDVYGYFDTIKKLIGG